MTLVDHLIVMTHNTARSAEDDELTNDFVRCFYVGSIV